MMLSLGNLLIVANGKQHNYDNQFLQYKTEIQKYVY